ncbi:hypothetical protein SAMN05216490_4373 [Mucilaginibacter mallensis]|uniref:Uncharacterized protein n=1 Tax=Mucilaginibacter mallensis TaxID=652787 RepID=A0A1H2BV93_MUCMA|nr:hypothetical protein [Mucilaginibacter mallensis]SDT61977.1 hypothetical protein SAMN05216490_4373 [Mucilaginibacter mallensis]
MKTIVKQLRQIIITALLISAALPVFAQTKRHGINSQHKDFYQLLRDANLTFKLPSGCKEISPVNNEYFSFDFAMEIPGKDFEMWLQVKSQRQNWNSYEHSQYNKERELANPDSMYKEISQAIAISLSGDTSYLVRNMPPDILARYNADAGKSYLVNLLNMRVTKHYKYALIIALQQNHTGTLVAVYFTNEKDPDFYKDVNRAGSCLKFIPPATD